MFKQIFLVSILVFLVFLSAGCTDLNPLDADIKIITVDIEKKDEMRESPFEDGAEGIYHIYKLTVKLKNVGNSGGKAKVEASHQLWMGDEDGWQTQASYGKDSDELYIEKEETITRLYTVSSFEPYPNNVYRIFIKVLNVDTLEMYDSYESII